MNSEKIEVRDLLKKYDDKIAVNHLSFTIKPGEPLAILGRNGSGKSTTLKSIMGLKKPTSGEILLPEDVKIGYLPEERGVYADATVKEHLMLFGEIAGVKNLKDVMEQWLDEMKIQQYKDYKLKYLSKGNAQKVQLIITLINEPDFVILDEPFSGLDPVNIRLFYNVIKKHCIHKYLLISSHQMDQVEGLCESVVMLNNGNVVANGKISDLKDQYGNSSVSVQYSKEVFEILEKYKPHRKDNILTVDLVDHGTTYKNVISDLVNSSIPMKFLKYDQMTMSDLFIRLLGE